MLHIGKKAPKGWTEKGEAIHLGKGIWILPVEKEVADEKKDA